MELKVNVIKAILTHNTEIGSKMDPYLILKLGTQQVKSKTLDEAGDLPQFDFSATFRVESGRQSLHVIVYDEDATVDDLVGEVLINIEPIILSTKTKQQWYSLKYNISRDGQNVVKKPAGKIMIEFECRRNGQLQAPSKQQVKQILQSKIHPIGMAPQHIAKKQLYGMETEEMAKAMTDYERKLGTDNSRKSIGMKAVYSIKNNAVRNRNDDSRAVYYGVQHGLTTTRTSTVLKQTGEVSSSSSKLSYVPISNVYNQIYYGNSRNEIQNGYQNQKIRISYQQPQSPNLIAKSSVVSSSPGWCRSCLS